MCGLTVPSWFGGIIAPFYGHTVTLEARCWTWPLMVCLHGESWVPFLQQAPTCWLSHVQVWEAQLRPDTLVYPPTPTPVIHLMTSCFWISWWCHCQWQESNQLGFSFHGDNREFRPKLISDGGPGEVKRHLHGNCRILEQLQRARKGLVSISHPFPSPEDLSDPGIESVSLTSPALAGEFFTATTTWEAPVPHHPV